MHSLPPSDDSPLLADHLLDEWVQTLPGAVPRPSAAVRHAFARFVSEVLQCNPDTNLNQADVQVVLHGATGLAVGRAEASGPGRALGALADAYHTRAAVGPNDAPYGRVLLSLLSHIDTELAMDELTAVLESVQQRTGPDWEIIFGHGIAADLPAELRVSILWAPGPR